MSTFVASSSTTASELLLVDLASIPSRALEPFWSLELSVWRDQLDWDVSGALSSLRRAVERGNVIGKAVLRGESTIAYSYYVVEGHRGVVSSFQIAADLAPFERGRVARLLLSAVVRDLTGRGACRIETQIVSNDAPDLVASFEDEGFQTHWRSFARLRLPKRGSASVSISSASTSSSSSPRLPVSYLPLRAWNLSEIANVMSRSHEGGCDAAMNELYRSASGCRLLLENVVRQRGCGTPVNQASSVARLDVSDRVVGFALVTETARRRAHLAQLAVGLDYQGNGLGRALIERAVASLVSRGYDTLSLMVSDGNERASSLYRSLGFETRFRFPVFSR